MKISELNIKKTVTRPTRNYRFDGSKETLTFEIPYNPNIDILFQRCFAKIIDMTLILAIIVGLSFLGIKEIFNTPLLIPFFLLGNIIIYPLIESLTGTTLGKMIFGLTVINDNCEKISVKFSIVKGLVISFHILRGIIRRPYIEDYEKWQAEMKFYVIKRKEKLKIKVMLKQQSFA